MGEVRVANPSRVSPEPGAGDEGLAGERLCVYLCAATASAALYSQAQRTGLLV